MNQSAGNEDLISVIIPVYNAGDYLEECLRSIVRQTYSAYEVILLDDASTDRSSSICRKYADTDTRFRYFRFEKREGQGCRRNYGISVSAGSYIAFVDSDDVIADDMLETMHRILIATDSEIAVCRLQTHPGFRDDKDPEEIIMDGHDAVFRFCNDPSFGAFSCNKFFRKDVFLRTGSYPEGMFYEDIAYIPQVCMNARRIVYSSRSLYYYRQHPGSVVGRRFFTGKLDQIKAYRLLLPAVTGKYPDLAPALHAKALYGIMSVYHVLIADESSPDPSVKNEILTAAREIRRKISFFHSTQKKRLLIFTFALCFSWGYNIFLKTLYKRFSKRGK